MWQVSRPMSLAQTDSPQLFPIDQGPDYSFEQKLSVHGPVCGVDEAGRGPLAGPVVAAAVILEPGAIPPGLDDSKKLTARQREKLFDILMAQTHSATACVNVATIDAINIRAASLLAMKMAVDGLPVEPAHALIDGNACPAELSCPATSLVKGDARSLSIAAASIVAKVTRDRIMERAGQDYQHYGFERHKGYGTRVHLDALAAHGPCPLHRISFAPVRNAKKNPARRAAAGFLNNA